MTYSPTSRMGFGQDFVLLRTVNKEMMAIQQSVSWPWPSWPDWEKESDPQLKDLVLVPLFALVFATVRYLLDKYILEALGRRFISGKEGSVMSEADNDAARKKMMKFKESAWKFVYYLTAESFALAVTSTEPWFTDTKKLWVGPGNQRWPHQMIKLKLKVLYEFAGGFYTYSIFALLFWETRRSDFVVSLSHHLATIVLIVFSYVSSFARVGALVVAIHDASDVFLETAKLGKYLGSEIGSSIAFVTFAVSWLLLRIIYFPSYIIRSTSYEVLQLLDKSYKWGPLLYYIFNTLLIMLFIMHIYWWVLIWRMIVRQVEARGKISDDVRSDSEDEGDDAKGD